jgi:hypothetical protein
MTNQRLRVTAVNSAPDSENRMHDDAVARTYGFAGGGLVPGVDIFGHLVQAVLLDEPDWMRAGNGGELRLLRPYFDGEEVLITRHNITRHNHEVWAGDRAVLRLSAPDLGPCPVNSMALPASRPEASQESLKIGTVLGSIRGVVIPESAARSLLELANEILMRNLLLKPWIHTGSRILWLEGATQVSGAARNGSEAQRNRQGGSAKTEENETTVPFCAGSSEPEEDGTNRRSIAARQVEVRGYIRNEWERKGHRFVTLDLSYVDAEDGTPVARVEHTAIWLYRRP